MIFDVVVTAACRVGTRSERWSNVVQPDAYAVLHVLRAAH